MNQESNFIAEFFSESVPKWVIAFIFMASIAIIYAGYWFYHEESDQIISQKEATLTSIATLKSNQITDWYLDELFDAEIITTSPAILETALQFHQNGTTADSSRLAMMLNQIKLEHDHGDIFLTTMDGRILVGTSPEFSRIVSEELLHIEKAIQEGHSVSTGLFRTELNGEKLIYISFISIIRDDNGTPIHAMVFRFNSTQFLFPLIEHWPIHSRTAESYIFKVEGDSALYLNNLRHYPDAALNFRLPLSQPELPASTAVSGITGVIRGIDYHNEKVISYVTKIESTPWFLVSKIEEKELFEEVSGIFWSVMGLVILGILFSTSIIGLIYNYRQNSIYRELYGKEKELWQQMEKFKVTMDSLGEGIIITDLGAKVQYINIRAEELTGWRNREAKGRLLEEVYTIINEETGERENNILEKVIKQGIVKELANHTILIHKNGDKIPVMDTGAPVFDQEGKLNGIVITFQDETERRLAQVRIMENEKYLESLFKSVPDTIIVLNKKGEILHFNPSSVDYLSGTDQVLRDQITELIPKEIKKLQNGETSNSQQDKQVVRFQFELTNNDENYHFNARMVPFGDDKVIVTLSDITETIQNFNRINSLLQIEEDQRKRLQNFTHIVSHNMRSHTANMEGLFDIIAMDEPEVLENQYIKLIKESSSNLRDTIGHLNQILDINHSERKDWKRIDLNKTVDRTISIVSSLSINGEVTFYNQIPKETCVNVIPAYLDSIVLNLLSNAVKFRSEQRDTHVKITTQFEEGYRIISFEDNGLGIDLKRHKEKLFGLYKTFHNHHDSRGLGLFMAKTQLEAMDGKIEVISELEKGSTFKVYLPDEKD